MFDVSNTIASIRSLVERAEQSPGRLVKKLHIVPHPPIFNVKTIFLTIDKKQKLFILKCRQINDVFKHKFSSACFPVVPSNGILDIVYLNCN